MLLNLPAPVAAQPAPVSITRLVALFCLVLASLSLAHPVRADAYLGIDGSSFAVNSESDDDLNPRGMRLRLGLRLSHLIDLEGHFGFASDDNSIAFDEFATVYSGAYLKAYAPLGARSAAYAMLGAAALELSETINGSKFTDDRVSFSYGFGLETQLTERLDLSADYMQYSSDDGLFEDVSAVSLGLKMYF